MGVGKCCCLSGSYRIRNFFGKSALDWDLFSNPDFADGHSPVGMDFSMGNSKFHSNGFSYKKELNLGEFLYDICADNKYVYVAAGDLGVKVLTERSGILTLHKTIKLFSPRTSNKKHGSLNIGGPRGSLYGYENTPFNGVYSICPAEKDGKILAACGKAGVKIIDVDLDSVSSVTHNFGNDFADTICNKIIKDGDFVFLGSTGWKKWPNEDKARQIIFHYDKDYDDKGYYPQSIIPAGVSINTLDSNGEWGTDPYIHEGRTLGVNDISIKQDSLIPETPTPGTTGTSGSPSEKTLIISYGRNWVDRQTGAGDAYRYWSQGGIDLIGYNEKNSKGDTEFVETYTVTDWIGDKNYDMPVMTADSGKGRHVFAFPGVSKNTGVSLFTPERGGHTTGDNIEHYFGAKKDNPGMSEKTSYAYAFIFAHCVDENLKKSLFGVDASFVFNPYTEDLEIKYTNYSSAEMSENRLKLPFEVFTSDINHEKNIKVTCVKGMGVMIEDTKPDSTGSTKADVFFGLTTEESFLRDPNRCDSPWNGENPRPKYWKDMTVGFFGFNPQNGFSNVEHTMSPVKSFIHKDKVYVIESNMVPKNECGPGYLAVFNHELMGKTFAECWFAQDPNHKSRTSGVIVFQKDSNIT